jgi:hypothetical protein
VDPASHAHGTPGPAAGAGWLPAAVVEHDAPGGRHFDLLLAEREPAGPDDRACATWRCAADPSGFGGGGRCACERIDDHRAAYLALEGPRELSGGRGAVRPVAVGRWRAGPAGAIEVEWALGSGTAPMTLRFAADGRGLGRTDE